MQDAEVNIDLPLSFRRPRGLFTQVAEQLPTLVRGGVNRLGLGVVHVPVPCTDSYAGPLDCDSQGLVNIPGNTGDDIDKSDAIRDFPLYEDDDGDELPYVTHPPFKIVDGLSCSNLSVPTRNTPNRSLPNTLRALAARNLSGMMTAELMTGAASGAPALVDVGTDMGAVSSMDEVAFRVETHLASVLHGDRGVVILPVGLLAAAVQSFWVVVNANSLETVSGHRVMADPGFTGDPENPKDDDPSSTFVFAMGDIFYEAGPFRELEGALNLSTNRLNQIIENFSQIAYNPCAVGHIEVTFDGADLIE